MPAGGAALRVAGLAPEGSGRLARKGRGTLAATSCALGLAALVAFAAAPASRAGLHPFRLGPLLLGGLLGAPLGYAAAPA